MAEELEITTSLDRGLIVQNDSVLKEVDEQIHYAIDHKDIEYAMEFCRKQMDKMRLSGIALAKALWLIERNWIVFKIGDDFIPTVQDYLGIHTHTIERYVKVWEMVTNHVPEELKEEMIQKPIGALIPVANAIAQGFTIEQGEWEKIVEAPDRNSIALIVREDVKNTTTRKNALIIKLDERGSLWVYSTNTKEFVGSLEITDESDAVRKAIERIVANSGILKG